MSAPPTITIEDRLAELNRTFDRYWRLNKRGLGKAIAHQARNFRVFLVGELKDIAPGAPAIEAENLARLKSGGGMTVSARAREIVARKFGVVMSKGREYMTGSGKRGFSKAQRDLLKNMQSHAAVKGGTLQALRVAQEIRLRKSHNKFTASAAVFRGDMTVTTYSKTKGGSKLGMMRTAATDEQSSAEFVWGGSVGKFSLMASEGMQKPKGNAALHRALAATTRDMQLYIDRKLSEAERKGINN